MQIKMSFEYKTQHQYRLTIKVTINMNHSSVDLSSVNTKIITTKADGNLGCDFESHRCKKVVELNRLMGSQSTHLHSQISIGKTYKALL